MLDTDLSPNKRGYDVVSFFKSCCERLIYERFQITVAVQGIGHHPNCISLLLLLCCSLKPHRVLNQRVQLT